MNMFLFFNLSPHSPLKCNPHQQHFPSQVKPSENVQVRFLLFRNLLVFLRLEPTYTVF